MLITPENVTAYLQILHYMAVHKMDFHNEDDLADAILDMNVIIQGPNMTDEEIDKTVSRIYATYVAYEEYSKQYFEKARNAQSKY